MKKVIVFTSLVLLTANVWALDKFLGDSTEYNQSILLDHNPGEKVHAMQKGGSEMNGSIYMTQPADERHMQGHGAEVKVDSVLDAPEWNGG